MATYLSSASLKFCIPYNQDSNGKYKEKLEIKNCEKRTLFGSIPFEANANWKLEDLSVIVEDDDEQSPDQASGITN